MDMFAIDTLVNHGVTAWFAASWVPWWLIAAAAMTAYEIHDHRRKGGAS